MKSVKITAVLLSVVLCMSMIVMPVGVMADDSVVPSEEQATETTDKNVTKTSQKPTARETEETIKEKTKESKKTDEKTTETTENTVPDPTKEKAVEPSEGKQTESVKETIPEKVDVDEPEASKETESETVKGKLPKTSTKISAKKALTGKCGDDVIWTFENGTLTISGKGDVSEIDDAWNWKNLTNLVVEDGVTSIWWIVSGCQTLTSVTLPETVTSIDDQAFSGCKNLKNITLPDSLTSIGMDAFRDCESLTSIVIPNSVTSISWYTFRGCKNLKNVTVSKELYDLLIEENWITDRFDDIDSIHFIFSTQADNPLTIKGKTATVKYKKLRKKNQILSVPKVIAFTKKGQGKLTYAKVSGNRKILINKVTGKITIKKKLKKGTYKVRVKVMASGNEQYKASDWKSVTIKIKVK